MTEADLIKQLKGLSGMGASSDWKTANRHLLISQISGQSVNRQPASFDKKVWYGFRAMMPTSLKNFILKPIGAISLMLAIIMGASVVSVSASRGSVPGDLLYKVKLTSEKIQAGLTVNDEKKTDLYINFAGERLHEMDKIKDAGQAEKKSENIKIALDGFTKQMNTVKTHIEKVSEKPKPAQDIVVVAKKVDDKVVEFTDRIDQKKAEMLDFAQKDLVRELDNAKEAVEEASDVAIEVIIEKHVKGEAEIPVEELAGKLEQKIKRAEEKIIKTQEEVEYLKDINSGDTEAEIKNPAGEQSVDSATADQVASIDQVAMPEPTTTKPIDLLNQVEDKPKEAQQLVEQAKELLLSGDLSSAFSRIIESKQITRQIEETINTVSGDGASAEPSMKADSLPAGTASSAPASGDATTID
ncbi:MAG: DUF5667 domain-containing protein [Patescibacteria group bacterium]